VREKEGEGELIGLLLRRRRRKREGDCPTKGD
jgi:hypothetical protein